MMTPKNTMASDAPSGLGVMIFLIGFAAVMTGGLFLLPTPQAETEAKAQADPSSGFAIVGARVFDGERLHDSADVWVEDGHIKAVGPALELPEGVETIDGSGQTLLPGLIDAHVHSWGPARQDAVRFGVTTMLDHFTAIEEVTAARKDRQQGGATDRADLFSAGTLATARGGHGTQYGMPVDTVDSVDEVDGWVAARLEEGSDWIKIVVEPGWGHSLATLDFETVKALIDAAHARGALAVVHVSTLDDALEVAKLGADGLVHVWRDRVPTPEEVKIIKDAGLFVVPTLVVVEGMVDPSPSLAMAEGEWGERLSDTQHGSLDRRFPPIASLDMSVPKESVRLLAEAGVPILAGSDAPNPSTAMGFSMHREIALLVESGLETEAALRAATSVPAKAFRLRGAGKDDAKNEEEKAEPVRGLITAGALADLILVDGDPLADISATRRLSKVWKAGNQIAFEPAPSTPQAVEEVASAPGGTLISDFEDGLKSRYGAGWGETTDKIRGGSSVAKLEVQDGALAISGEVKAGSMFPWSGGMVFLGPKPMQPVDLSSRKELVFRVRGDGRRYTAMLFSGDMQAIPPTRTFDSTSEWQTIVFELESFYNAKPGQLRAVAFTAGAPAGEFRFEIDDVEIR